jgi:site-specific DNA-methyltransferase (adenine-specific)
LGVTSKIEFILETKDCVDGMKAMGEDTVDVVVTSPPYNLGKEYTTYDDKRTPEEYLAWCKEWAHQVLRVLKPDGSFFLNIGSASSNPLFPLEVAATMKEVFALQNIIHWVKSISIEQEKGVESYGHFKPINSPRFLNDCHEYVFHFTRNGITPLNRLAIGVPYMDKTNIKRWAHTEGRDKRCRGNTWFVPYKTIQRRDKQRPHPATFPTQLAVNCIRLHGRKNATVLDPFLGIGHSAVAAKECHDLVAKFVGFDIDSEYVSVAKQIVVSNEGLFKSIFHKSDKEPSRPALMPTFAMA